eukprot:TRINITY_DN1711_c0_g2_i1.p1 TRINITY_DN1711_c0_g2~~TRINITY_DN1711_c0_g2_i1.p1  ORF type:complete len:212 (+),score=36.94 TRINITY_DN1711_c0_g2_i1:244-879(+)
MARPAAEWSAAATAATAAACSSSASRRCAVRPAGTSAGSSAWCCPVAPQTAAVPLPVVNSCVPPELVCYPASELKPALSPAPVAGALSPSSFGEPVLVDEKSARQAHGGNPAALYVSTLTAVVQRLSSKPVVIVGFVQSACLDEFVQDATAKNLLVLRRKLVFHRLYSARYVMCWSVDTDEFPLLYSQALAVCQSPFLRDGRVRLEYVVVY